jgi:hypothetical protein
MTRSVYLCNRTRYRKSQRCVPLAYLSIRGKKISRASIQSWFLVKSALAAAPIGWLLIESISISH